MPEIPSNQPKDLEVPKPTLSDHLVVSPGVNLRLPTTDDTARIIELAAANRADLQAVFPWARTLNDQASAEAYIAERRDGFTNRKSLSLFIEKDGQVVGAVSARFDWENRRASLGGWLDQGARNKGLMSAAGRRLTEHCFRDLGIHRVEADITTDNAASQALARNLGLVHEGCRRDYWLDEDGQYRDVDMYSVLASDWSQPNSGNEMPPKDS